MEYIHKHGAKKCVCFLSSGQAPANKLFIDETIHFRGRRDGSSNLSKHTHHSFIIFFKKNNFSFTTVFKARMHTHSMSNTKTKTVYNSQHCFFIIHFIFFLQRPQQGR